MVGIYKITNLINNKVYIGQSKNIYERWNAHKKVSFNSNEIEYNTPIHKAIRKYGINNFSFEIIEECPISELDKKEKYYIQQYKSFPPTKNKGYNQTPGGQGPSSKVYEYIDEIIKSLTHTSLTQKQISQKFNITEEIIQGINTGRYWRRDDIKYPIRERRNIKGDLWKPKKKNYCPICGKEIFQGSKCCLQCRSIYYQSEERKKGIKINPPPRESLLLDFYNLKNNRKVANKYNISTVLLNRWQDELNIPRKRKDYIEEYEINYLGIEKKEVFKDNTKKLILKIDPLSREVLQVFKNKREAIISIGGKPESSTGIDNAIKKKSLYKGFYWEKL